MLIQYDGAHPEVVVDELDSETAIKAGVPTEVPDELAARLLEQSTWSQAKPLAPVVPITSAPSATDNATKGDS